MFCKQCGKEIGDAKFCPYCGATQEDGNMQGAASQQTQQENVQQDQSYQPIDQQPYQQPYQQNYAASNDAPNMGFSILSFFIPIVGLVLYLVWNKEYPQKAKSCLKGLITGVVMYVIGVCCLMSVGIWAANSYEDDYYYSSGMFNTVVETVPYE